MWKGSARAILCCSLLAGLSIGQSAIGPQTAPGKTAPRAQAETKKTADRHLVRVETVVTPAEMATEFYPPLKCDSEGNVYLQTDPGAPAIHKLNSKGERVAVFSPSSNPDLKIDYSKYFSITTSGELYELVLPHEINRYIFIYKSDGNFKSSFKLQTGFAWKPDVFAVFSTGHLLVTGLEYDRDKAAAMWPFTGIFAADGSLLKEVKLEDDGTLRDMASSGDQRVVVPMNPQGNRAVSASQMEVGSDGNVYLMRWTNPAIFYAVSAGGQVVRRFAVDPGESSFRPLDMHVANNRIAVLFFDRQSKEAIIKIVDLDGREIATYDQPRVNGNPQYGITMVCYTENPTRFVFLGAGDDNRIQFWITEPR
jgi:hypothetical protein